jgi:putative PIG3 family NAD(P)H quinone oxidoreductase
MRAVVYEGSGGVEAIAIREVPQPVPGPGALLVRVHATALNRGDILQRQGEYSIPPGQSSIPGVEVAGEVEGWGAHVTGWRRGQRVYGVVEGGGFADYALLDAGMANPLPEAWTFVQAAAAAESFLTANETLFELGGLAPDSSVLVHAAASSIGATMVQMVRHVGATAYAVVGSEEKRQRVLALGATAAINRKLHDFAVEVRRLRGGAGLSLVMDFIGGTALAANLSLLEPGGCLVAVGLLDGLSGEIDLLRVVEKRLQIKGSSLRLRPLREKREVNRRFRERWQDPLAHGLVAPVVHAVYPLDQLAAAQAEMEANRNVGKIVLALTPSASSPAAG